MRWHRGSAHGAALGFAERLVQVHRGAAVLLVDVAPQHDEMHDREHAARFPVVHLLAEDVVEGALDARIAIEERARGTRADELYDRCIGEQRTMRPGFAHALAAGTLT